MTFERLKDIIAPLNIPIAENRFKKVTSPPFIIIQIKRAKSFFADDSRYKKIQLFRLMLVTHNEDAALQNRLEQLLDDAGILYENDGVYIDAERIYQATYEFEEMEGNTC